MENRVGFLKSRCLFGAGGGGGNQMLPEPTAA